MPFSLLQHWRTCRLVELPTQKPQMFLNIWAFSDHPRIQGIHLSLRHNPNPNQAPTQKPKCPDRIKMNHIDNTLSRYAHWIYPAGLDTAANTVANATNIVALAIITSVTVAKLWLNISRRKMRLFFIPISCSALGVFVFCSKGSGWKLMIKTRCYFHVLM